MENGQAWGIVAAPDGQFRIVPGGMKRVALTVTDTPSGSQEEMIEEVSHFIQKPDSVTEEIPVMEVTYEELKQGERTINAACDISFLPLGDVQELRDVLIKEEQTEFFVSSDTATSFPDALAQANAMFPTDPTVLAAIFHDAGSVYYSVDKSPRALWKK